MDFPRRKKNRLPFFDYSTNGGYFVTICTEHRKNTLCTIVGDGSPVPKRSGQIAARLIQQISVKFPCVVIDNYVVMPNHIHILLRINDIVGTGSPPPTLGKIIAWYKYQVTKTVNDASGTIGAKLFQRSYHDHVIRGDKDYLKIWEYITNNPARWGEDCFYTEESGTGNPSPTSLLRR